MPEVQYTAIDIDKRVFQATVVNLESVGVVEPRLSGSDLK
jgi:hypothetical protein